MIADPDFDTGTDQITRDIGLDIGEANNEIRLKIENGRDLRARKGRDFRLLLARPRWAHGKTGNANDAVFLAERVENLGRLFSQADDALRERIGIRHHG